MKALGLLIKWARLSIYVILFSSVLLPLGAKAELYAGADNALLTHSESARNAARAEAIQQQERAKQEMHAAGLSLIDQVSKVIDDLQSSIQGKAALLVPEGKMLLSALSGIAIMWLGMRLILQGASIAEVAAEAINLIFIIGMATWVVTSSDLTAQIMNGFDVIASKIMSSSGELATDNGIQSAIGALVEAVVRISDQPNDFSLWDTDTYGAPIVAMMKVFMSLFLLAVTLAYLGMFVMTQVMFGIALILGPVLAPFYIIQPLSFIATGWFKFLLSTGMAKVTGALILTLTVGFIKEAGHYLSALDPNEGAPLVIYSGVFLITGIMALMMMQAWSIGSSIMTGVSRMSSGLPSKLQPGGMAMSASGSMQGAARQGARAVNMTTGAAAGALGGAKAAKEAGGSKTMGSIKGAMAGMDAARKTMDGKAPKTSMSPISVAMNASAAARKNDKNDPK